MFVSSYRNTSGSLRRQESSCFLLPHVKEKKKRKKRKKEKKNVRVALIGLGPVHAAREESYIECFTLKMQ